MCAVHACFEEAAMCAAAVLSLQGLPLQPNVFTVGGVKATVLVRACRHIEKPTVTAGSVVEHRNCRFVVAAAAGQGEAEEAAA